MPKSIVQDVDKKYQLFDPRVDYAFKTMFTYNTESKKALINFINSVIKPNDSKIIKDITYINTHVKTDYPDEKQSIMDIKVITKDGEKIDIEMQLNDDDDFIDRSIYYLSTMISEQKLKGKSYNEMERCIIISILNFDMLGETEDYHSIFEFRERKNDFKLSDKMEIHYVELNKFKDYDISKLDTLDKWIIFLKDVTDDTKRDIINKIRREEEKIDMAAKVLEKISQDEKMQIEYKEREMWLRDLKSKEIHMIERGKFIAAKNMLLRGMSIEDVCEISELSINQVKEIKQQMNKSPH